MKPLLNNPACSSCGSKNTKIQADTLREWQCGSSPEAGYNTVLWCVDCLHEEYGPSEDYFKKLLDKLTIRR
ncbi:MAG TPA: hypothetical protein EYN67_14975 [Flavobacteriales bacterium]|nr:hypothetical protein [Flavobacteriales bacterium]